MSVREAQLLGKACAQMRKEVIRPEVIQQAVEREMESALDRFSNLLQALAFAAESGEPEFVRMASYDLKKVYMEAWVRCLQP